MKRIRTPSSSSSGVSRSIRSANIAIRPSTSSRGRVQFSVENEYTVSSSIPNSAASRSRALTTSAPAWWPSIGASPRCCAQRPLPSVMIATYGPPALRRVRPAAQTSRISSSLAFISASISPIALSVSFCSVALGAALLVLARLALLADLLEVVHHVAADVAHRDPALLGDAVDDA